MIPLSWVSFQSIPIIVFPLPDFCRVMDINFLNGPSPFLDFEVMQRLQQLPSQQKQHTPRPMNPPQNPYLAKSLLTNLSNLHIQFFCTHRCDNCIMHHLQFGCGYNPPPRDNYQWLSIFPPKVVQYLGQAHWPPPLTPPLPTSTPVTTTTIPCMDDHTFQFITKSLYPHIRVFILSLGIIFNPLLRLFEAWAVIHPYFGGCVSHLWGQCKYSLLVTKIELSNNILISGMILLGIKRRFMTDTH